MEYNNDNMATIMKCKNIVFDYVEWFGAIIRPYTNVNLVIHLIDNVVDIDARDSEIHYTLFTKILVYGTTPEIIHHMLNNKCIKYSYFRELSGMREYIKLYK